MLQTRRLKKIIAAVFKGKSKMLGGSSVCNDSLCIFHASLIVRVHMLGTTDVSTEHC